MIESQPGLNPVERAPGVPLPNPEMPMVMIGRRPQQAETGEVLHIVENGPLTDQGLTAIDQTLDYIERYGLPPDRPNGNSNGRLRDPNDAEHGALTLDQLRTIRERLATSIDVMRTPPETEEIELGGGRTRIVDHGSKIMYQPTRYREDGRTFRDPRIKNEEGRELNADLVGDIFDKTSEDHWLLDEEDETFLRRIVDAFDLKTVRPEKMQPKVHSRDTLKDKILYKETPRAHKPAPRGPRPPEAQELQDRRLSKSEIKRIKQWYRDDKRNGVGQHAALLASDQSVLAAAKAYATGRLRLHEEILESRRPERPPAEDIESDGPFDLTDEITEVTTAADGSTEVGGVDLDTIEAQVEQSVDHKRTELEVRRYQYGREATGRAESQARREARAEADRVVANIQARFDDLYDRFYDEEIDRRGPRATREAARVARRRAEQDPAMSRLLAGRADRAREAHDRTYETRRNALTQPALIDSIVQARIDDELARHRRELEAKPRYVAMQEERARIEAERIERERDEQLAILEAEEGIRTDFYDTALEEELEALQASRPLRMAARAMWLNADPSRIAIIDAEIHAEAELRARARVAPEVRVNREAMNYSEEEMDRILPDTVEPRMIDDFHDAEAEYLVALRDDDNEALAEAGFLMHDIATRLEAKTGDTSLLEIWEREYNNV
jgi:hypothetical protein